MVVVSWFHVLTVLPLPVPVFGMWCFSNTSTFCLVMDRIMTCGETIYNSRGDSRTEDRDRQLMAKYRPGRELFRSLCRAENYGEHSSAVSPILRSTGATEVLPPAVDLSQREASSFCNT